MGADATPGGISEIRVDFRQSPLALAMPIAASRHHDCVFARRASLLTGLICVAVSGCGGAGSQGVAATGPGVGAGTVVAPAPDRARITLLAPVPRTTVRGTLRDERVEVSVDVVGLASPGERVTTASVNCTVPCASTTVADGSGTWQATLPMTLSATATEASVVAAYDSTRPGEVPASVALALNVPGQPQIVAPAARRTPREREAPPEEELPPPSGPASDGGGGPRPVTLIGDSLSVNQEALLETELPGWPVTSDARIGRPLAEGMGILADTALPAGGVLAMGLFTNDDPSHTSQLAAAVAESLRRAGPSGCAIWATIAAPPVQGRTFDAANLLLNELALRDPRLRIVQWAQAIQQFPSLLAGDGVHPQPAGAGLRAQLFAQAARSCP